MFLLRRIGRWLAKFLSKPRAQLSVRTHRPGQLEATLQKGDVLLVEGTSRISGAIKYLTQSNWSHATLYIGDTLGDKNSDGELLSLIEADVLDGVRTVPLSRYENMHTRICRADGLSEGDLQQLLSSIISRIGHQYDLKNVFDLARYFISTPPVPGSWKRRMLAFGSGDPTRAICSSLIAESFQSIRYPILPDIELQQQCGKDGERSRREIIHIRHHSLFAPKDFDVSPYFRIIKPTLEQGFDFHQFNWHALDQTERDAE